MNFLLIAVKLLSTIKLIHVTFSNVRNLTKETIND